MSNQIIPIYIPTFIGDQNYAPNRVLPHVYFYNGQLECQPFFVADQYDSNRQVNAFPYFDNYSVVTGSFPTPGSKSLLFNNENAPYGSVPTSSLYTEYWETYISLLYNPKTRLVNCSAIIPLADYVKMELNDVVNFRGNYYYLRAINDYSVKTGQCKLQLLGPIIADTLSDLQPTPEPPPPPPTAYATASIKLAEWNESPTAFLDANLIISGTTYYFSGDFTQSISGGTTANVVMEGKDSGSTVWGPYTTSSATLTIRDNGTLVTSSTQYVYSGSGDITITIPTTFTAGHNFQITGSMLPITGSTPPTTSGSFTLDAQYGINITDVVSSTGTMPAFTFPQDSGDPQQILDMVSGFDAGNQFEITLSGTRTPAGNKSVRVYVNNVEQDCATISTDGGQTKYLTITPATLSSDDVRISIASSAC